jgi:hypothetical protein
VADVRGEISVSTQIATACCLRQVRQVQVRPACQVRKLCGSRVSRTFGVDYIARS